MFAFAVLPAVLVSTITACSSGPTVPAGNGSWLETAYGPPWDAINGSGTTAYGIDLRAGPPMLVSRSTPRSSSRSPITTCGPTRSAPRRVHRGRDRRRDQRPPHRHLRLAGRANQTAWGPATTSPSPRPPTPAPAMPLGQTQAPTHPAARRPNCTSRRRSPTRSRTPTSMAPSGSTWASTTPARADRRQWRRQTLTYRQARLGPAGAPSLRRRARWRRRLPPRRRARQGRYVYVTEGIVPTVQAKAGQAGQPIATFTGCIETGSGWRPRREPMAAVPGQACGSGDPGCRST